MSTSTFTDLIGFDQPIPKPTLLEVDDYDEYDHPANPVENPVSSQNNSSGSLQEQGLPSSSKGSLEVGELRGTVSHLSKRTATGLEVATLPTASHQLIPVTPYRPTTSSAVTKLGATQTSVAAKSDGTIANGSGEGSFLIHLPNGETHVWRPPTSLAAKVQPRNPPRRLENRVQLGLLDSNTNASTTSQVSTRNQGGQASLSRLPIRQVAPPGSRASRVGRYRPSSLARSSATPSPPDLGNSSASNSTGTSGNPSRSSSNSPPPPYQPSSSSNQTPFFDTSTDESFTPSVTSSLGTYVSEELKTTIPYSSKPIILDQIHEVHNLWTKVAERFPYPTVSLIKPTKGEELYTPVGDDWIPDPEDPRKGSIRAGAKKREEKIKSLERYQYSIHRTEKVPLGEVNQNIQQNKQKDILGPFSETREGNPGNTLQLSLKPDFEDYGSDIDSDNEYVVEYPDIFGANTYDLLGIEDPDILGPVYGEDIDRYSDFGSNIDGDYEYKDHDHKENKETDFLVKIDDALGGLGSKSESKMTSSGSTLAGARGRWGHGGNITPRETATLDLGVPIYRRIPRVHENGSSPGDEDELVSGISRISHDSPTSPKDDQQESSHLLNIQSAFERVTSRASPRQDLSLADFQNHSPLQRSIMSRWISSDLSSSRLKGIRQICDLLGRMINQAFDGGGDPVLGGRYVVDVFGSMAWGGQTGDGGDLDLVVRDRALPHGYHPDLWRTSPEQGIKVNSNARVPAPNPKLPDIYNLQHLVGLLRRKGYRDVFGVYGASTPIVKFKAQSPLPPYLDQECDLNMNDLGGWYNSRLILAYCEISPLVLRPLIHALKLWASAQEVNDPSGSKSPPSMSSYCLTLMAIAYLQCRGNLPNLQANITFSTPDLPWEGGPGIIWVGWGKEQGTKLHVGFDTSPPTGWSPSEPNLTAEESLRGFFSFFSRVSLSAREEKYNHQTEIVSILNGGIIDRAVFLGGLASSGVNTRLSREDNLRREWMMGTGNEGIQPRNWCERRLVVQDPFIWQKNCAQAMSRAGLDRWFDAVDWTHRRLFSLGKGARLEDIILSHSPLPPRVGPTGFSAGRGRGR